MVVFFIFQTSTDHTYSELIKILMKHGDKKKYGWMQRRMEDLWYGWSEAKHKLDLPRRRQKKVQMYTWNWQVSSITCRYRIIPNKGTPIVWPKQTVPKLMAKVSITPVMIVRFSIRNHSWKAQNLSFNPLLSDYLIGYNTVCPPVCPPTFLFNILWLWSIQTNIES